MCELIIFHLILGSGLWYLFRIIGAILSRSPSFIFFSFFSFFTSLFVEEEENELFFWRLRKNYWDKEEIIRERNREQQKEKKSVFLNSMIVRYIEYSSIQFNDREKSVFLNSMACFVFLNWSCKQSIAILLLMYFPLFIIRPFLLNSLGCTFLDKPKKLSFITRNVHGP